MKRRRHGLPKALLALFLVVATALALPGGFSAVAPARAQEAGRSEGGGLLRFLFGRREVKQDRAQPNTTSPRRATTVRRSPSDSPSAQPATPAVEKAEDARRVLVVGDFLAGSLAAGRGEAVGVHPTLVVVDPYKRSAGVGRDDN